MSGVMSVYCKAYQLKLLRSFSGWRERAPGLDGDAVVFLHSDFTVTEGVFANDKVLFAGDEDGWQAFCRQQLEFEIPADVTRAIEFTAAQSAGAP